MIRHAARFGIFILIMLIGGAQHATAQGTSSPKQGSAERRAIMEALRVPVERQLKQKTVFVINHLKVKQGWAFLTGRPQQPDGKPINYKKTPYASALEAGAFDDGISALLHQKGKKWVVVQYSIGATDVPWEDWDKRFKAPSAIFKLQN
jgi:hypothetical protein